jgi:hypothetical protein
MDQICENVTAGLNNLLLVKGSSLIHRRMFVKEINECIHHILMSYSEKNKLQSRLVAAQKRVTLRK